MWRYLFQWILSLVNKPKPSPGPPPPQGDQAAKCIDEHNRIREKHGLGKLVGHPCLGNQAQQHAEWMRKNRFLTHDGLPERLRACNFYTGSENVAEGFHSGVSVVSDGWMNSEGHRENILKPGWKSIGVGYDGGYWCAMYTY